MNTIITLPRATVEQALEALEEACEIIGAAWAWRDEKGKPTITALRDVLAQQAESQIEDRLARHGIPIPGDKK